MAAFTSHADAEAAVHALEDTVNTGRLSATTLDANYAGLDPTTGDVLDGNGNPVKGAILLLEAGATVPAGTPVGTIVFQKA